MTQDFYIDVVLQAPANTDTLNTLLRWGEHLGIGYFDYENDTSRYEKCLPIEQVIAIILDGLDCARRNPQDFTKIAHITIKAYTTYASVIFYEHEEKLALSLRPASTFWITDPQDDESIDLPKYKELLMHWCQDFAVCTTEEIDSWDAEYS